MGIDEYTDSLPSPYQLTLGEIIDKCQEIINRGYKCRDGKGPSVIYDFENFYPTSINSYRGFYDQLALNIETEKSRMELIDFTAMLKNAVGKTFEGYKGGEYVMDRDTYVWVANYGNCGQTAIIEIVDNDYEVIIITGYRP